MNAPSQLDFAQQVRSERLAGLWKITLALSFFAAWGVMILLATKASTDLIAAVAPVIAIVIGCLMTRSYLRQNKYTTAVWCYTLGC